MSFRSHCGGGSLYPILLSPSPEASRGCTGPSWGRGGDSSLGASSPQKPSLESGAAHRPGASWGGGGLLRQEGLFLLGLEASSGFLNSPLAVGLARAVDYSGTSCVLPPTAQVSLAGFLKPIPSLGHKRPAGLSSLTPPPAGLGDPCARPFVPWDPIGPPFWPHVRLVGNQRLVRPT